MVLFASRTVADDAPTDYPVVIREDVVQVKGVPTFESEMIGMGFTESRARREAVAFTVLERAFAAATISAIDHFHSLLVQADSPTRLRHRAPCLFEQAGIRGRLDMGARML